MESDKIKFIAKRLDEKWLSLMVSHLLITDVTTHFKEVLKGILQEKGWVKNDDIDDKKHKYLWLTENTKLTPLKLYNILKDNEGIDIIFENDDAFSKKAIIDVLEGAICSSPDSCSKWLVRLENKPPFSFKGRITILTKFPYQHLKRRKKYEYLLRDMLKSSCT